MDLTLKIKREEAQKKIQAQIDEGRVIYKRGEIILYPNHDAETVTNWNEISPDIYTWDEFNSNELAFEYNNCAGEIHEQNFTYPMNRRIAKLSSINKRLELIPDSDSSFIKLSRAKANVNGKDVFIVHGRDLGVRGNVARFIQRLQLNPIILDEIPNKGKTLIEKFEDNSENVGYAVVLLTPDDTGGLVSAEEHELRARQNAIFELGYFHGKLGRGKVNIVHKGKLEIPSDLSGILFTPYDEYGGWKFQLAAEISASGVDIDLNLLK